MNDQLRKKTKTISDECYRERRKTFYDMGNVHVCHIGISGIHGKELVGQLSFHQDYKRSHNETNVRQISTKCEQDEISGMETIGWENHLWKYMSWIGDERVINLQRTKVYVFSDYVLCPGKIHETTQSNGAWKTDWDGSYHLRNTETLTELTVTQWNSSGIFSQDSIRCSSVKKSNFYC